MRQFLLGLLAAAVVLLTVLACALRGNADGGHTFTVTRRPVTVTLVEFGEVEALEVRAVVAPISGEITWVADEGTAVKVGDRILSMNTQDLESRLEEDSRAGVGLKGTLTTRQATATAIKKHREAAALKAELELNIARAKLTQARVRPTDEEKKLAELDLRAARLRAEQADAEDQSLETLSESGFVSEAKAKTAQLDLIRSRAEQVRAEAVHAEVLAGTAPEAIRSLEVSVKKAEMALAQAKFAAEADVAIAAEQVAVAQTRYDVHRAGLTRIEKDIAAADAPSPIDGVVALVDVWKGGSDMSPVGVGENHRRGRELMKIADISSLRVKVLVNERDIVAVRVGQPAEVRLVSQPGVVYPARVGKIAAYAEDKNLKLGSLAMEKSGTAGVNVVDAFLDLEIPPGAEQPRLGSTAEVEVTLRKFPNEEFPDALPVPLDAVRWEDGRASVRVKRGGGFQAIAVRIAATTSTEAVVVEGLSEGDQVLLGEAR